MGEVGCGADMCVLVCVHACVEGWKCGVDMCVFPEGSLSYWVMLYLQSTYLALISFFFILRQAYTKLHRLA